MSRRNAPAGLSSPSSQAASPLFVPRPPSAGPAAPSTVTSPITSAMAAGPAGAVADLHTHSTASDGELSPSRLVRRAASLGLSALALTDHDTLAGLAEASRAGAELGVKVIPGVELGACEQRYLHILGYGFPLNPPVLAHLCQEMQRGRDQRKYRILAYLEQKGVPITLEEVENLANGVVARPHFAQALFMRGYVKSVREAFDLYLDTDDFQRIERFKPTAAACIEAIHLSGGFACLAHPCQLHFTDEQLDELLKELRGFGLDALECFYPQHQPQQVQFYLSLAKKYGLHVTGGSDFHGERVRPGVELASLPLDLAWLTGMENQ